MPKKMRIFWKKAVKLPQRRGQFYSFFPKIYSFFPTPPLCFQYKGFHHLIPPALTFVSI